MAKTATKKKSVKQPDLFDTRRAQEISELAKDPEKLAARATKVQSKLELKAEKLAEEKKK